MVIATKSICAVNSQILIMALCCGVVYECTVCGTIVTSISNLALGYVDGSRKFGENKNLSTVCKNWKKIRDGQRNLTIITFASGNKLRF